MLIHQHENVKISLLSLLVVEISVLNVLLV
jgi:hypothetical protein